MPRGRGFALGVKFGHRTHSEGLSKQAAKNKRRGAPATARFAWRVTIGITAAPSAEQMAVETPVEKECSDAPLPTFVPHRDRPRFAEGIIGNSPLHAGCRFSLGVKRGAHITESASQLDDRHFNDFIIRPPGPDAFTESLSLQLGWVQVPFLWKAGTDDLRKNHRH
jgi:hypothetical protein